MRLFKAVQHHPVHFIYQKNTAYNSHKLIGLQVARYKRSILIINNLYQAGNRRYFFNFQTLIILSIVYLPRSRNLRSIFSLIHRDVLLSIDSSTF